MEYLTVNETARLLRVSPITIRRYIASGKLSAERVGRGVRVRREAIADFVTPIMSTAGKLENGSDNDLVEIYSPSSPEGSVFVPNNELLDEPNTEDDPLWNIIGIARSGNPTDVSANKYEYLAEAFTTSSPDEEEAEPDELVGQPFTMDDPLWNMFGIGESDDPTEVAENKHEYLAEAYLSDKG